ncbi:efflux RND transporter permease subunit [Alteromonas oceanisediminis]|uniref:efflux RND transporter permease subunit n=1 Tax=Alteromonas oceanisediminis TaxID=2836180 RepID=UPI001BD9411D|nr:efflux RND transporter permease subunit [Alteromonas oceanisediminis]MBT0586117.1 efflux RND transporter permease subunit [Alteromonas oceanisediminis]
MKSPWYTLFFRRGHLLVLGLVIILVAGYSALTTLPRLEDPRIDTRNMLILTPYPGASAERVEALVTDVIEDRLREIYEIKEIESTSRSEISVIAVELQDWVDNNSNEQLFSEIRDAISEVSHRFPAGSGDPILDEKRGATAFTVLYAVKPAFPETTSLTMVSRLSSELADRLRNVAGTELVRIYGEPSEEFVVSIDPQKLSATGLTINDVSRAITAADPKLPAGVVYTERQNIRLQVAEPLAGLDMIRAIPLVNQQGLLLRLGDIATIDRRFQQPMNDIGYVNGEQVIFVAARMQTTVRVDQWTGAIKQVATDFQQEFAGSLSTELVFEQNVYTEQRLSELSQNLLMGCAVVMFVVLVFMGLRASIIVGLALPLCAAFALFSLSFYGEQIHQMSIFGIIIAIGLLIDNAIVITDETRLNLQDPALSRLQALEKTIRHLFAPLLASTLTTILGFMPVFLLNGNIGDFIGGIAISVVMALVGSLFISLTLIAALAARYLSRDASPERAWYRGGLQLPSVSTAFKALLRSAIEHPVRVLPAVVLFCVSGFVLSAQLANVFFPSADRDQFEIYVWTADGTGITNTESVALQIDEKLRRHNSVEQVTWLVGGSAPSVYYNQVMTRDNTPSFANAVVTVDSISDAAQMIGELQISLSDAFPQAQIVVRAFGQGPPIAAPIEVDIFGPDLETLNELGMQVRLAMTKVPGITQSIASITQAEPEFRLNAERDVSEMAALSLTSIANQLQTALRGQSGGSVLEGTEDIPVRVRIGDNLRSSIIDVANQPLNSAALTQQGQSTTVAAMGDFALHATISGITRKNGERLNRVQAFLLPNVPAIDVSNQLRDLLLNGAITLPQGYRLKMAGDADEQAQAVGQLGTYAPVLLVLMITTLILTFNSVRMAGVIAIVAMLSVGLGFFSLWISGLPVGFNPLLGCAGLIGVAINGSIVVIAAINANADAKAGKTDAIMHETMSCSRHILSTTFTTIGGLIPLLLFSEGSFWPPLAVVLAGGVGFSVILSLLFTPSLVAWLCRRRSARRARQEQPATSVNPQISV